MRELLDASSQRIIGILEVLSVQKGWITLTELADHVEASERTVSADLSVLRRRWGQKLRIEISTKTESEWEIRAPEFWAVFCWIFSTIQWR